MKHKTYKILVLLPATTVEFNECLKFLYIGLWDQQQPSSIIPRYVKYSRSFTQTKKTLVFPVKSQIFK